MRCAAFVRLVVRRAVVCLILPGLFGICAVHGQEAGEAAIPIKFSGLWLSGKFVDIDADFPVGREFIVKEGDDASAALTREILVRLREMSKPGRGRLVDALASDDYTPDASQGRGLLMACVVNQEFVDRVTIGGVVKLTAQVGFDLVVCDFTSRRVLFVMPGWAGEYFSAGDLAKKFGGDEGNALRWVYRNKLAGEFVRAAANFTPELRGDGRLGVTKVTIFDEAKAVLPKQFAGDRAEDYISRLAVSNLSEGFGIRMGGKVAQEKAYRAGASAGGEGMSMESARKSQVSGLAIAPLDLPGIGCMPLSRGNEMMFCGMREGLSDAMRVAVQSEREARGGMAFVLPKPEYEVEVTVPAFRTVSTGDQAAGKVVQYCSYARVAVKRGEKVIYSSQHDFNTAGLIPRGSPEKTQWVSYEDSVCGLFLRAGEKIREAAFLAKAVDETKPAVRVIDPSAVKAMLRDCAPWLLQSGDAPKDLNPNPKTKPKKK